MDPAEALLAQWRTLQEAGWARAGAGLGADACAGLGGAAAAYTRFAQDFARLAQRRFAADAPSDAERLAEELRALGERFFAGMLPMPGAASGAAAANEGLAAWSRVLSAIAREAATHFAARLGAPDAPSSLRAAFDVWIDCAESAFQQAAHGEAFVAAQARLLNDFVATRAAQQTLLERGARLAGMPIRADIDALYASVRALERDVASLRAALVPAPAAKPRPRKRSR